LMSGQARLPERKNKNARIRRRRERAL